MLGNLIRRFWSGPDARSAFAAGKLAYERGDLQSAARLFDSALRADSTDAESHLYAGLTHYGREQYREALEHFERAAALVPSSSEYSYQAAAADYMLGNVERAWQRCEEGAHKDPSFTLCHHLMARIALPGPSYMMHLEAIHKLLRPRTYVEIGVDHCASLRLAQPETRAIGIDPAPKIASPLPANTVVHAMTSDDYFAQRDVRQDLGGLPIDLAFIDGLHQFEYALRDFINIERHSTPETTVLVHDCYPLDRETAERVCRFAFASGDVWRLTLLLKKYRPDLRIATIGTAPTGLAMVCGLDPESRVLERNLDSIIGEWLAVDYSILEPDKAGLLNLFPNDWERIKPFLLEPAKS